MKFGESLRKERELRGITLEEISTQTKVHARFLEAIEQGDLSALPAKAFAKGFLRSYARIVGLDEDQVMANFEYCHRAMQPEGNSHPPTKQASGTSRSKVLLVVLLLIVAVLVTVMALYYQGYLRMKWF